MTRGKPETPSADAQRAAYGFSPQDWLRIKALAEATTRERSAPSLEDLSVPYRVSAVMAVDRRHFSGRQIGTWQGRAILVTPIMGDRGISAWVARRRTATRG